MWGEAGLWEAPPPGRRRALDPPSSWKGGAGRAARTRAGCGEARRSPRFLGRARKAQEPDLLQLPVSCLLHPAAPLERSRKSTRKNQRLFPGQTQVQVSELCRYVPPRSCRARARGDKTRVVWGGRPCGSRPPRGGFLRGPVHPTGLRILTRGVIGSEASGLGSQGTQSPALPDALPGRGTGSSACSCRLCTPASPTAGSGKLFNPFRDAAVPETLAEPAG